MCEYDKGMNIKFNEKSMVILLRKVKKKYEEDNYKYKKVCKCKKQKSPTFL